ncbi:MAG: hypothetical protein ACFFAS_01690 [Promethearchaeota archaeon]
MTDDIPLTDDLRLYLKETHHEPVYGGGFDQELIIELKKLDSNFDVAEYKKAVKEFYEWFENEKSILEEKYAHTSKEARIIAAKDLIEFILEAKKKWDEILQPELIGEWEGTSKFSSIGKISSGGVTIPMEASAVSDMRIEMKSLAENAERLMIDGKETNGKASFIAGPAMGLPPGTPIGRLINTKANFTSDVKGVFSENRAYLFVGMDFGLQTARAIETEHGPMLRANVFSGGERTNQAYIKAVAIFGLIGFNISIPKITASRFHHLILLGIEQFDPMKYLIEYFKQYVITIDTERLAQLTNNPKNDHIIAKSTIDLLLETHSYGIALGIPPDTFNDVLLVFKNPQSLYDKWFREWFFLGLMYHNEQVASHNKDIFSLLGRFLFILKAAQERFREVFSEQPFEDEGLFIPSHILDSAYKPYYIESVEAWKRTISEDSSELELALEWLKYQSDYYAGAIVSLECCLEIGLRPEPPRAQFEFEALGGE